MKQSDSNLENNKSGSTDEISRIRGRSFINLLVMPIYLFIFGCLGLALWQVAIKLAAEPEPKTKILLGLGALLITLIEIILAYFVVRFTRWALHQKSTIKRN